MARRLPAKSPDRPGVMVRPPTGEETACQSTARSLLDSTAQSAVLSESLYKVSTETVGALICELREQCDAVNRNDFKSVEQMLFSQAHTLNQLFFEMVHNSIANRNGNFHVSESYMRLALKTQSQTRTTLEALNEIKNPRSVAFVKQANVANNQQVNNGCAAHAEKGKNAPNELNGVVHEQAMDPRGSCKAGQGNSQVAAVGEVHRTKNGRRKGESKRK